MTTRALYGYVAVSFEEPGLQERAVYGYPNIAFEEPGLQARAIYAYPNIAFEEPGLQVRAVYGYLQITFAVSPNTPPEWHLFDGFNMVGILRDVEER